MVHFQQSLGSFQHQLYAHQRSVMQQKHVQPNEAAHRAKRPPPHTAYCCLIFFMALVRVCACFVKHICLHACRFYVCNTTTMQWPVHSSSRLVHVMDRVSAPAHLQSTRLPVQLKTAPTKTSNQMQPAKGQKQHAQAVCCCETREVLW